MDESRLICAKYDDVKAFWVPLSDSIPDPANNKVVCKTRSFSTFQIMEAIAPSAFNQAKIYPNPFIPSRGHSQVKFSNLPSDSLIVIYTLTGEKIAEITATTGGLAEWDARNISGEPVASGIYLIYISAGNSRQVFKLGVER